MKKENKKEINPKKGNYREIFLFPTFRYKYL